MTILENIASYKREEVARAKTQAPLGVLEKQIRLNSAPRGFRARLLEKQSGGQFALIAEIKKASPSKGIIREDLNPEALARAYEQGGATCLSVLTDTPSFQGRLESLQIACEATRLPILRKDFMLDPYQVAEARAFGADCILVILAMVDDAIARALMEESKAYGMDTLVEVHDEPELQRALALGAKMIGVNNRDLKTFQTDLNVTLSLAPKIPDDVLIVAESGLSTRADLECLAAAGVTTFLIGETLMRQTDVAAATRALIGDKVGP
ncbi:MAG TPA: indole-3-glycerol phosphate synthase TrpC [Rhizomicrobium sp.]|nr:indole-3-glycerol phosphate synthase TrpC [Rhizomicrobium sp.]